MLNVNVDWYGNISKDEAVRDYGWGYAIADDSPVLISETSSNTVYIGRMEDGDWCCEIEGFEEPSVWNMIGQGFGDSADKALEAAIVDIVASDAMRENQNSEDAVNVAAYEAYQFAYGETPIWQLDREQMDRFLCAARKCVKARCRFFGFEWEEF